jgi:hypothetical protein
MADAKHLTISGAGNTFIILANQGILTHALNATGFQISEAVCPHKEACNAFQLYHNEDKALCNQPIKATSEVFIQAVKDSTF